MFLNGDAIPSPGPRGELVVDDSFLLLFNASPEPRKWAISGAWGEAWQSVLDTSSREAPQANGTGGGGGAGNGNGDAGEVLRGEVAVTDRSVVLLRRAASPADE